MALMQSMLLAVAAGTALALPPAPVPDVTGPVPVPGQWTKYEGSAKCTENGTCVASNDGGECFWDNEFQSFPNGSIYHWSYCTTDTSDDSKTVKDRIKL